MFVFFVFACVGSTLTPLTPIPVSDVGKSMLPSPSLSVLGDQQFQTGLFIYHSLPMINIILIIQDHSYIIHHHSLIILYFFSLQLEVEVSVLSSHQPITTTQLPVIPNILLRTEVIVTALLVVF